VVAPRPATQPLPTRRWLRHIEKPRLDAPVADLPPSIEWRIKGISADDRWVVVVGSAEARLLVNVDTVAGDAGEIAV